MTNINKYDIIKITKKGGKKMNMLEFQREFEEAKKKLINIGFQELENKQYKLSFDTKSTKILGNCRKFSDGSYEIILNKRHSEIDPLESVRDTIIHELCHSIKGCMNHGKPWQIVTNYVNAVYGYHITTKAEASKEYIQEVIDKREPYKYVVCCEKCNLQTKYKRMSKTLQNIANNTGIYRCKHCKGSLKVKTI